MHHLDVLCVLCSATYVKVYVLENGVCLAKKKTKVVKKNLDPTYQQALLFDESPQGKVLQVGDFFSFLLYTQNKLKSCHELEDFLNHRSTVTASCPHVLHR